MSQLRAVSPPAMYLAIARPTFSQGGLLFLTFAGLIALRPALGANPWTWSGWGRTLGAGVLLAVVLGWLVAQTALVPLNALTATVEDLAETTDVTRRLTPGGSDELGRLRRADSLP